MKRTAVIMAGGSGERFWPVSRRNNPKQLLKLNSPDMTMLEESIARIEPLIPKEDIFIITSEILANPIRRVLKDFPAENVIPEPAKRNTAPCLALAAAVIASKYMSKGFQLDALSIAVLTSDQAIKPNHLFIQTVAAALDYAEQNKKLVTIGITPDRPETGYGYVEIFDKFDDSPEPSIAEVISFREKPNYDAANEYVNSGRFLWNSGMFFWRLDTFIDELKVHLPEVACYIKPFINKLADKLAEPHNSIAEYIGDEFSACPNISIDYGLMERSRNVAVAKALFKWDDVGSWDSLRRSRYIDEAGNVLSGDISFFDTTNSIIINETNGNSIVAVIGLDNIAVITSGDAILVCPVDRVQEVKKSVEDIKRCYGNRWI